MRAAMVIGVLCLELGLTWRAGASTDGSSPQPPEEYGFVCGDLAHEVPFSPGDLRGTLIHQDVKGRSVRTSAALGEGAGRAEIHYRVALSIEDPGMTGVAAPFQVQFDCHFIEGSLGGMDCRDLAPFYPKDSGINRMLLVLPVPDSLQQSETATWPAVVGARKVQDVAIGSKHADRYVSLKREMTCRVRLPEL